MADFEDVSFTQAARARIAAIGIRGLSLRTVAQGAGGSVSSLSYHIGDKAALIARLIQEERQERQQRYRAWRARAAPLDLTDPKILATLIDAYLEEAATVLREMTLTGCELLLEATIDPGGFDDIADLLIEEDQFWTALLARDKPHQSALLGPAIAAYCRDEMPFAIALTASPDYRLLRSAIVQRLTEGLAGPPTGLALAFEPLVAACGETSASVPLPIDLTEGSRKTAIAMHIADLMAEKGLAGLSHRAVAARAGTANSNVAHHFRTKEDLIHGGLCAQILRARQELGRNANGEEGMWLIRATHMVALAAARDPHMAPFALDMRRRRAENVMESMANAVGGPDGLDKPAVQAATMVMIGSGFAARARRSDDPNAVLTANRLSELRAACSSGI